MTKLEEIKAAAEEARDAAETAGTSWDEDITWAAWGALWDACHAARDAYEAELKKTQEENSND